MQENLSDTLATFLQLTNVSAPSVLAVSPQECLWSVPSDADSMDCSPELTGAFSTTSDYWQEHELHSDFY